MKLGIIIQRYGLDISGGAELHCRLIAERLAKYHQVHVFTTCAKDYVTWKNFYPAGTEVINGVTVHRFPVKHPRRLHRFFDVQNLVFSGHYPSQFEEKWVRENGPFCPKLIQAARKSEAQGKIQAWLLYCYRYWTTAEALRQLKKTTLLNPTAEHDPALYLGIFKDLLSRPRVILYNCLEEQKLVQKVTGNRHVPSIIAGVGPVSDTLPDPKYAHQKFAQYDPYFIYVGRIDKNKGCDHLFRFFRRLYREKSLDVRLLLLGTTVLDIPKDPRIIHLGFVPEQDKMAAIMASRALIMPSPFESLSIVVLEAWSTGRPVIANRRCEVLEGQCLRSNGGIPYSGYDEFYNALKCLLQRPDIADRLGHQGKKYFQKHYTWPVIEEIYARLLSEIEKEVSP